MPRSASSETGWVFDTVVTFWAVIKFGIELDNSSIQRNKTTITCGLYSSFRGRADKWRVHSEVADDWIQNGGPVSLQGVGYLGELSVLKILSIFCKRLDNMPWSIAQRFEHALTNRSNEQKLHTDTCKQPSIISTSQRPYLSSALFKKQHTLLQSAEYHPFLNTASHPYLCMAQDKLEIYMQSS